MGFILAIDGPAGSGKGTIAKLLSERLNLVNIDTGAMYRSVALACIKKNISETQIDKIVEVLEDIKIELKRENDVQKVYLNNEDVTKDIRTTEVDDCVAKFAAIKEVREKITPMQREMGKIANIVMEGRDIGTVVFPNADVKIFLECSVEERANRRYKQNLEKGIECSYEDVLNSIKERHILETQREIAPFVKAEDAILVDSTKLSIEEVVAEIENIIKNKNTK